MERTYYGEEGASSLSPRRRNLAGAVARSEQRFNCGARRDLSVQLRAALSKVWNFCCDFHRLWLWERPQCAYQLENDRCVSRTNGTRLVVCWLSHQPCECVGSFLLSTAGTQERFFAFQRFSALTIQALHFGAPSPN